MVNLRREWQMPELSEALRAAIAANFLRVEVDLSAVAGRDLADLKQILRGEKVVKTPVDRQRAINTLAQSERSVEAAQILERILADPVAPAAERAAAARNLGLMPAEAAEAALLSKLDSSDEFVRTEIIHSLGRIGSTEALRRLQDLPLPTDPFQRRQLALARVAIGLRNQPSTWDAAEGMKALGVRWSEHNVKAVNEKQVEEAVAVLRGATYGVQLNTDIAYELRCGRLWYNVLLNDELQRGALVSRGRQGPLLAGLVALRTHGVAYSTVRYLLLTQPRGQMVEVLVARLDGQVAFAGQALPEGSGLRLRLRDVGVERVPAEIEGQVTDDDLQLILRVWRGPARAKRHGEPMVVTSSASADSS